MAAGADHPLARLALVPVCLAQGLVVARRARQLPEPPGPRFGSAGQGPALRLLIVGDSSAAGVGAPHQDAALAGRLVAALDDFALDWRLEARTGATTRTTLARLGALPPARFDAAVVALGVNDVTRLVSPGRWRRAQDDLADLLAGRFGVRWIYRSGVPPMGLFPLLPEPLRSVLGARARDLDTVLAAHCRARADTRHLPVEAAFLDPALMAEDGFHPGPALYARWAEAIARAIRADFAPR